jgi:hypothetical protein
MTTLAENIVQTRLIADTSGYTKGFQNAAKSLKEFIDRNRTVGDVIKNTTSALLGASPAALLAGGALTAVGIAAISSAKQAATLAGELLPLAQRLGTTTEELSVLKFASEQSNTSFGDTTAGLRVLGRTAGLAAAGNKQATKSFNDLGIELRNDNGQLKTTTELFKEVADVVARTEDPILKAGKASSVLGRNAQSLIPLLNQGAAGIDGFAKEAEELGIVISSRFARDVDDFSANMNRLKSFSIGAGQAIAQELLPGINQLLDLLVRVGKPVLEGLVLLMQDLGFGTFKLAGLFGVAAGGAKLFFAQLRNDKSAIAQALQQIDGYNEALGTTRDEWLELRNAESPAKPIKDTGEAAGAATDALQELVSEMTALDRATSPVVNLAKDIAGSFPSTNARFQELVQNLRNVTTAGPEAAEALRGVLAVAAQTEIGVAEEIGAAAESATQGRIERGRPPEFAGRVGGVQGPATREGDLPAEFATNVDASREAARALGAEFANLRGQSAIFFEDAIAGINGLNQAFLTFGNALGEGLVEAIAGANVAFGDLFRNLLKDLAKAIVRATVLTAIMSILPGGGAFSLAKLTKNIQGALGLGGQGFQDKESSILGRTSQARNLLTGIGGGVPAVAAAAAGGAPNFRVIVEEPGPFTKVRITDDMVIPRLRQRRRQLNEEPF